MLVEVKSVQGNVLQTIASHISQLKTDLDDTAPTPQVQALNTTTLDAVQLEILRVIKEQ